MDDSVRRSRWYLNGLNFLFRGFKFVFFFLLAYVIYATLLSRILTHKIHIFTYIAFWLFTAYIVVPRINRRIAKIYLPDYFIGRTRTSDGLFGDPINLALDGRERDIIKAMEEAGWSLAEPLNLKTGWRMTYTSILGKSYETAPVSPLYLFGNKQDLAFQKQIGNNPRKRHHVRFWKTPESWHLPGGSQADWLAAATYDKNVGLSLFTGQITHKIDANVDQERDFLIETLQKSKLLRKITVVKHFTTSYHSRNGGGDRIHTDGALPFIQIGPK